MSGTWADRINRRDPTVKAELARCVLRLRGDNLVERPWGGSRLASLKGVDLSTPAGRRFGESFELSADESDPEAAAHPSIVVFADGSQLDLPSVLRFAAEEILGAAHVQRYGATIPLLPKTLDIEELLSVQAHPAGNPEAYFVLEAGRNASIRLGFRQDVDPEELRARCTEGRATQERLLAALVDELDQSWLHRELSTRLADPECSARELAPGLESSLRPNHTVAEIEGYLDALEAIYWETLDRMNEIFVERGQVIFNATLDGRSAEVHALGNPACEEIVLLEVRRPGVTFRAWDNVRFPMRPIDVERAVANMSLIGRRGESFIVEPEPVPGRPGVARSVCCEAFEVHHLSPTRSQNVELPSEGRSRVLLGLNGRAMLRTNQTESIEVGPNQSVLLPAPLGVCELCALDTHVEVLEVCLPDR